MLSPLRGARERFGAWGSKAYSTSQVDRLLVGPLRKIDLVWSYVRGSGNTQVTMLSPHRFLRSSCIFGVCLAALTLAACAASDPIVGEAGTGGTSETGAGGSSAGSLGAGEAGSVGTAGTTGPGLAGSIGSGGTNGEAGTTGAAGTTASAGTHGAGRGGTTGAAGTTASAGTNGAAGRGGTTGAAGTIGGAGRGGVTGTGGTGRGGTTGTGGGGTTGTGGAGTGGAPMIDCNAALPSGGTAHTSSNQSGTAAGMNWTIWTNSGPGTITTFSVPAFSASWNGSGDFLARLGLQWN